MGEAQDRMRAAVVINPIAGAGSHRATARDRVALARALLAAEGVDGDVHLTARAGHAFELAQEALSRDASLVVAWGGDGTVNEVGRALVFSVASLGIIPAGSGNGLARELRVPVRPAEALQAALRGTDRTIDAGELGKRLFFNTAGIGFDADVAARFNARARGRRGLIPYVALATRALFEYRPREYTIRVDGDTLRCRALLVACANSRQYGGGAVIAPRARLDDGALDLVVVENQPSLRLLWNARRLFVGTLANAPGVRMRTFTEMEVAASEPLLFHVDGESLVGGRCLIARVHPGALRVRAA